MTYPPTPNALADLRSVLFATAVGRGDLCDGTSYSFMGCVEVDDSGFMWFHWILSSAWGFGKKKISPGVHRTGSHASHMISHAWHCGCHRGLYWCSAETKLCITVTSFDTSFVSVLAIVVVRRTWGMRWSFHKCRENEIKTWHVLPVWAVSPRYIWRDSTSSYQSPRCHLAILLRGRQLFS